MKALEKGLECSTFSESMGHHSLPAQQVAFPGTPGFFFINPSPVAFGSISY
jgi:hypothetical protein